MAFVDFPGYGFALARNEKATAWNELVYEYKVLQLITQTRDFFKKRSLKLLFLLVDARIGLKASDIEYMNMLDEFDLHYDLYNSTRSRVRYRVVLTKVDKVPQEELAKRYQLILEDLKKANLKLLEKEISMVSVYTKAGLNELRQIIYPFAKKKLEKQNKTPS